MSRTELAFTPAVELAGLIRERQLSPVELVESTLARIEALNPAINAYCTLVPDRALADARAAEAAVLRGDDLGPLHGIPVSIKDLTPTAGIRTTSGSRLFADHVPAEDALVVQRLKAAGAIVVGKTNTPEMGAGLNTTNVLFGPSRNPWDTALSTGGSSGGAAAALAAGLGPLAEGTDHGGSLRLPASLCGVVGFRTTPGRIPRYPTAWASDVYSVTGPMARTIADTALMLSVMAGPDDRIPISIDEPGDVFADAARGDVKGWRVAWSRDLGVAPAVEPEVVSLLERAALTFADLGAELAEATPDFADLWEMIPPLRSYRTAAATPYLFEPGAAEKLDAPFLKEYVEKPSTLSLMDVARAERMKSDLWQRCRQFFQQHDLLLAPTTPAAAFPVEHLQWPEIAGYRLRGALDAIILTYAFTMTGLPAISVPMGWTAAGLPVGMQIVGPWHGEAKVLRAAAAFEAAMPWADRRPPLG